ncbi:MAG: GMC family oxidoreductase [Myxococcales bacterium]|nr:GMC family oxidoreductase [Myxococcales bacterium]
MREFDAIVIGSGFGGSVAALRLAERGYRVAVLEQGQRVTRELMERAATDPRRFLWLPELGWSGYFSQEIYRHVTIVRGVAVGGGSIVYAAVLLQPKAPFYADPLYSRLGLDWQRELAPHYATAKRMLGVTTCPTQSTMDERLRAAAERMGVGESFGPSPVGIYFGEPGVTRDDPLLGGEGPPRTGCRLCGECMGGCQHNAKNTLDKNYLYLAEKHGATIFPSHRALRLSPTSAGYRVDAVDPASGEWHQAFQGRYVFLAAGVIGTLELLFRSAREARTLERLSDQLGRVVRTNSESIVAVTDLEKRVDLSDGPAISSHFYANPTTHVTLNRFPRAFEWMKWQTIPLVDGSVAWRRALSAVARVLRSPIEASRVWRMKEWHRYVTPLTVMQDRDNQLRFTWRRSLLPPFQRGLRTETVQGREAPSYIYEANHAARALADVSGGFASNSAADSLLGASTTAHILGGCHMGARPEEGVIDGDHQVYGYPGLFVVDASAISANVGVNPSLTITAMAERCLARFHDAHSGRAMRP